MREIEIKAKLEKKDEVIKKLEDLNCVFTKKFQHDIVFWPKGLDNADQVKSLRSGNSGINFLRIRIQQKGDDKKIIFTLKQPQKNDLDCIEHEVEIDNPEVMSEILTMMDYNQVMEIKKQRMTAKHGEYEICIDDVDGLGCYIEVEKLADEGDADIVQKELFDFAETLGVKRENEEKDGYDVLLWRKRGM